MKFSPKQALLIALLPINTLLTGFGITQFKDNKENADHIENKLAADFKALEQDEAFMQKRDIAQKIEVVENEDTGVRQFFMDGEELDLENEADQAKVDAYYDVKEAGAGLQNQVDALESADKKTASDALVTGGALLALYTATGLLMVQDRRERQKVDNAPKKAATHGM